VSRSDERETKRAGPKAPILLTLLLMSGAGRAEIARVFADIGPLT
tara:strand:- start:144 stop:278 length:135 start_codon:yes stop_codon:yes gene_type:complete